MSEKYKLGLTRNRLFEFDNCVIFAGKYNCTVDCCEGDRALKMLSLKEPLITGAVELSGEGEAYVVTDSVVQEIIKCAETVDEIIVRYENQGLRFYEKLFEFSLSSDGYFVIVGHTCVADAKALLRLAKYFSVLYKKKSFSVNPSQIRIISDKKELPLEALSPVIDRLSLELESKWAGNSVVFGVEDYNRAKKAYDSEKAEKGTLKAEISENTIERLKLYAEKSSVDVSSVVGYAFYERLCTNTVRKASVCRMGVYGDSRFFFDENDCFGIGAFNGTVNTYLKKKEALQDFNKKVKAFHINRYKGVTSTLKVLYDDAFMMSLSPSLCDSAYMYASGCFKNKVSARLAENYGCKSERFCDYFSCNLDQAYWAELKDYIDLTVKEPFKMRSYSYLGFVVENGRGFVTFSYKKSAYSDEKAEEILKNALGIIEGFE